MQGLPMNNDNSFFGITLLTSAATTIMAFFDAHAAGIGAICTICTFIIYAVISYSKWRWLRNAKLQQKLYQDTLDL